MAKADLGHFAVPNSPVVYARADTPQVGSIWISYLIAVVVLFFFAIGFAKLYQHRTEKDGFVTTVTVLAITTVAPSDPVWRHKR